MSRLEELIKELCPDGVEYKSLGEIGNFYGGLTGKSKVLSAKLSTSALFTLNTTT